MHLGRPVVVRGNCIVPVAAFLYWVCQHVALRYEIVGHFATHCLTHGLPYSEARSAKLKKFCERYVSLTKMNEKPTSTVCPFGTSFLCTGMCPDVIR